MIEIHFSVYQKNLKLNILFSTFSHSKTTLFWSNMVYLLNIENSTKLETTEWPTTPLVIQMGLFWSISLQRYSRRVVVLFQHINLGWVALTFLNLCYNVTLWLAIHFTNHQTRLKTNHVWNLDTLIISYCIIQGYGQDVSKPLAQFK